MNREGERKMYDLILEGQSTENNNQREQLIRDMIYVCLLPNLSQKNRREFIDVCISWSYSDRSESNIIRSAKYKGCRYWSEEALKRIDDSGNWADAKKDKELRHEHIVPRSIFINAIDTYFESLRNKIRKNEGDINKIANRAFEALSDKMKIMKGCVVTKHEAELIDGKSRGQKATEYIEMICLKALTTPPSHAKKNLGTFSMILQMSGHVIKQN